MATESALSVDQWLEKARGLAPIVEQYRDEAEEMAQSFKSNGGTA